MFVVPKIDSSKAQQILAKPPRPLAAAKRIIKVRLAYLPNHLFTFSLQNRKGLKTLQKICVDAVDGNFAFYEDTELSDKQTVAGRLVVSKISAEQAEQIGRDELHRMVLRQSLKKRDEISICDTKYESLIYYPYWIGYFRRRGGYDFDVIDSLTGQRQGAKMKPMFIRAILEGIRPE